MRKYSIIIPVYNRPDEVDELLESLLHQTYTHFEVLIIEDGSTQPCEEVVKKYTNQLTIRYYAKPNSGQGFSRNYGFERAEGDFYIVYDSDCLIPPHYLQAVEDYLQEHQLDAYGGPDRAHESFTATQKAISYSMTSPFTTGGIRGNKKHVGTFHPRSFNMGISKAVWEQTQGYTLTRMGEDIEFSIRIMEAGFQVGLIPDAYVYHKRRTNLRQFWKQLHFFGRARINISRLFPSELKLVHTFPALFLLAVVTWLVLWLFSTPLFALATGLVLAYCLAILIHSTLLNHSLGIGLLSIATSFTQLMAYGAGFIQEGVKRPFEDKAASLARQKTGAKV